MIRRGDFWWKKFGFIVENLESGSLVILAKIGDFSAAKQGIVEICWDVSESKQWNFQPKNGVEAPAFGIYFLVSGNQLMWIYIPKERSKQPISEGILRN